MSKRVPRQRSSSQFELNRVARPKSSGFSRPQKKKQGPLLLDEKYATLPNNWKTPVLVTEKYSVYRNDFLAEFPQKNRDYTPASSRRKRGGLTKDALITLESQKHKRSQSWDPPSFPVLPHNQRGEKSATAEQLLREKLEAQLKYERERDMRKEHKGRPSNNHSRARHSRSSSDSSNIRLKQQQKAMQQKNNQTSPISERSAFKVRRKSGSHEHPSNTVDQLASLERLLEHRYQQIARSGIVPPYSPSMHSLESIYDQNFLVFSKMSDKEKADISMALNDIEGEIANLRKSMELSEQVESERCEAPDPITMLFGDTDIDLGNDPELAAFASIAEEKEKPATRKSSHDDIDKYEGARNLALSPTALQQKPEPRAGVFSPTPSSVSFSPSPTSAFQNISTE